MTNKRCLHPACMHACEVFTNRPSKTTYNDIDNFIHVVSIILLGSVVDSRHRFTANIMKVNLYFAAANLMLTLQAKLALT